MNVPGPTVLLGDDEEALRRVLRARLAARGYTIYEAATGEQVLERVAALHPDVIILDIGLPDIDGIELTRRLRTQVQTPIIMLSVRATQSDKIAALEAGADDYLTKPCDLTELLARIRAVLRRSTAPASRVFSSGDLVVDLDSRVVQVANHPVQLTATEYKLLSVLVCNAGRLLTQRRLAEQIWGEIGGDRALQMLRTTIGTLRLKLDASAAGPGHIAAEPGVGYRLRIALPN